MKNKILYIFDARDWRSRMPLAHAAKESGYDVSLALIGAQVDPSVVDEAKGFATYFVVLDDAQMGGRQLYSLVSQLRGLLLKVKPAVVHAVTLKYAFACGLARIGVRDGAAVYTLAGLGYLFRSTSMKAKIIRSCLKPVLRMVLSSPKTKVVFQNPDDLALMVETGYVAQDHAVLIKGSGVDLKRFVYVPERRDDVLPLVLMPTRLVKEKGLDIFIEAARILEEKGLQARFQIAGGEIAHNPRSISAEQMCEMIKGTPVEWLGRVVDMPGLLAQAAVIVYPSYYGEGIPRVLLEAAAVGRPIVTTDHPGCREAVDDGVSGVLVPVRDALATADAIEPLLFDPDGRTQMGIAARAKAEAEFDSEIIAKQTVKVYSSF